MIKQNIQKDLFEEMNDKEFIKKADEVICDIIEKASLYVREETNGERTYDLNLYSGFTRDVQDKMKIYFAGAYYTKLFQLVKEYEGKEDAELKLGGEE